MGYLNYFILKKRLYTLALKSKKTLFFITNWIEKRHKVRPFTIAVLRKLLNQIMKSLVLVALLVYGDRFITINYIKTSPVKDLNLLSDLIIAGVSIAGIFLGLYCSNLTSIYVTKYSNAPESIAHIFEGEVLTNNSINLISSYIVFSLLLLGANLLFQIGVPSLCVFIIFTIWIIISFGLIGNNRQRLSDTYGIALDVYINIAKLIKKVASNNMLAKDANFQNHYQKLCNGKLNELNDITKYNLSDPANRNEAMVQFMGKNNSILSAYLKHKKLIPFKSLWFPTKQEYQKWYYASDTEVNIALQTGTVLNHKQVKNFSWFEDSIFETNRVMLDRLLSIKDYSSLSIFCLSLKYLAEHVIEGGIGGYFLDYIEKVQEKIVSSFTEESSKQESHDNEVQGSLLDILLAIYVEVVISINKYMESIDWDKLRCYALSLCDYKKLDLSKNCFLNNRRSEKLYHGIFAENQIERKKITADWFIEQNLAYSILEVINEQALVFDRIYNDIIFHLGKMFSEKGEHFYAMLVFSRMPEVYTKMQMSFYYFNKLTAILNEKHIEKSTIWPDNYLLQFEQKVTQTNKELPKLWSVSSLYFTVNNWNFTDKYPDLLGQCYNYICYTLIEVITKSDYDSFEAIYPNLLSISLVYQEVARKELTKIKEESHKFTGISNYAIPVIEFATISGYAYLWGEITNDHRWKEIVESQLEQYLKKQGDKAAEICLNWIGLAQFFSDRGLFINNRGLIHINWQQKIENTIRDKKLLTYEWGLYGEHLKTDNSFLKAFLGYDLNFIFLSSEAYEVFFIIFLNRNVPKKNRYESRSKWEKQMGEEIVK